MELSKNSWLLKIYKFGTYDPDVHDKFSYDTGKYEYVPPNNSCKMIRGCVWSVLVFLISWPVWVVSILVGSPLYGRIIPGITALLYFLYSVGVISAVEEGTTLADIPWTVWVYEWSYPFLIVAGIVGGVIGLLWICSLAAETGPFEAFTQTAASIKNKYCIKITWKDDEEK